MNWHFLLKSAFAALIFLTELVLTMDKATHEKIVAEITAERFPFPVPTTYRKVLETYIDLTARPSPELLLALSEHASDPDFRATFESYGSDGGLYDTEIAQRQVRVG